MRARLGKWIEDFGATFWAVPAALVVAAVVLAEIMLQLDRAGFGGHGAWLSRYLYGGDSAGAQTLLGVIAASSIGVAGTVFSITIAALSLAASQMGPRLLRNFTRDRGNQVTLGVFLGTFGYALTVLRTVRSTGTQHFVPHIALTLGLALGFVCLGFLIYFVQHVASRINVETVIELEYAAVERAVGRLTEASPAGFPPWRVDWDRAENVLDDRTGYLQVLDVEGLADWAQASAVRVRLLVRPGDYLFPGTPVALVLWARPAEEAAAHERMEAARQAIVRATALGQLRVSALDLEFSVRQLVEVAVRALSPGINDPNTAVSVLERLGTTLCDLAGRHLDDGMVLREDRVVVAWPASGYGGICDLMFHTIRQNAAGSPPVLIRMLEVLARVASRETVPGRRAALRRHGALVLADGARTIGNGGDLANLRQRHAELTAMLRFGPAPRTLLPRPRTG